MSMCGEVYLISACISALILSNLRPLTIKLLSPPDPASENTYHFNSQPPF